MVKTNNTSLQLIQSIKLGVEVSLKSAKEKRKVKLSNFLIVITGIVVKLQRDWLVEAEAVIMIPKECWMLLSEPSRCTGDFSTPESWRECAGVGYVTLVADEFKDVEGEGKEDNRKLSLLTFGLTAGR